MDRICFDKPTFNMWLFLLICLFVFFIYITYYTLNNNNLNNNLNNFKQIQDTLNEKLLNERLLNDKLQNITIQYDKCQTEKRFQIEKLQLHTQKQQNEKEIQLKLLNKIYNPLESPLKYNPQGSFTEPGFNANKENQLLGYVTNSDGQYPIYGRYYNNRSDRFEYYTINEGKNKIKIPIKTKNYEELYTDDKVNIPELSTTEFIFKKYENEGFRYNPNII